MTMARSHSAAMGGLSGRALDKHAEDELYALKAENLALKKKLNVQDDRAKKLTTKVQRLSEDLIRNKEVMAGDGPEHSKVGKAKPIKGEFKNIEEAYDLIEDLRLQLKEVTKENTVTRNKMQYFRTLHEAETRKRTPYDHIPPRIQGASQKKRLQPGLVLKSKPGGMASAKPSNNPSPEPVNHHSQEELEKLEEMNGMLRLKLSEADAELEKLRQDASRTSEAMDKDQHQHDIERAALQLELTESRKREREIAGKFDTLDERFRAMLEAHQEALRVSDELNEDLKEERRRCVDMEHELKKISSDRHENEELLELIHDLREEKRLLEQEQANLLDAQFNRDREEEYQNEIEELRENLRKHIKDLAYHLDEKRAIHEENETLKEHLREIRDEKHDADRHMFEIQQELDELREKMNFFCKDGEIDISEIEEALSIVRLRRERGISLDFLMEAEELYADKELLQELRVQYADCIHELEKIRKLLYLQEHINKDYKLECEELNRKMEALKNGYELRLEEDSRLLDLRANKIAHLEGQLKSIVYGTAKIPGEIERPKDDDDDDVVELATGQNMIEIHIESALISDDGLYYIRKLGIDMEDSAKLTTFIHYDFFEFETQVSPMGLGQKPVFNFTSKYKVYTDDFFLQYLQSKSTVMYFSVSNGLDFHNVATCSMVMKELTDPDRTDRLRYYADLISTHDERTIIGKIDFGLRVRLPMAQAIRSYKERTVALNLLTVSDKEVSSRRFRPRSDTNDLVIRIINCTHLRQPPGRVPAVFASFQFYIHETMVTETIRNSTSPMINFLRILPLPMTSDLDRYLRTGSLHIMVLDDNDGIEDFEYGSVAIPLLSLALGEKIYDEYFLSDGFGNSKSKITVSLEWSKPYKLNIVPLISQLDEHVASSNGRSNKAVHSQDNGDDDDDTESKSHDAASHTDAESETMNKYKASDEDKRKQYKRRQMSDEDDESKPSRPSNDTSTTGDRDSVVTSSTNDPKHSAPSEVSAMSAIDERDDDHHNEKKSHHDVRKSKDTIDRRSKDALHDSEKKKSSADLHKKSKDKLHDEKDEQRHSSKENMGSRKQSHKSLKEEDKPISRKSSRRTSPHRSLEDVQDEQPHASKHSIKKSSKDHLSSHKSLKEEKHSSSHKSSHKSLKEDHEEKHPASHKSSHKSLKEDKEEKHSASHKSSHKSLKEDKEEKHSGSHKSSHKSLKEETSHKKKDGEEEEEERHGSRKSSHKSLNEHKSAGSKQSLKKSKSALKINESSESSSSDGESGSKESGGASSAHSGSESGEKEAKKSKSSLKKDSSAETTKSTSSSDESDDSDKSGSVTPKPKMPPKHSSKHKEENSSSSKSSSNNSSVESFKSADENKSNNESEASNNSSSSPPPTSSSSSDTPKHSKMKGKSNESLSPSESSSASKESKSSSILSDAERNLFSKEKKKHDSVTSSITESSSSSEKEEEEKSSTSTTDDTSNNQISHSNNSDDTASTASSSSSSSSTSKNSHKTNLTLKIKNLYFKQQSPKTQRLLRNVSQFFVSFEFLDFPAEELETHSVERDQESGAHALNYSKTFPLHPFKNEDSRYELTKLLNSRNPRDHTILFTVVSEPTEDSSDPDAECEDIAYAKLDLLELASEAQQHDQNGRKNSLEKELQIWDSNGDILMGTLVVVVKGVSVLSECLE